MYDMHKDIEKILWRLSQYINSNALNFLKVFYRPSVIFMPHEFAMAGEDSIKGRLEAILAPFWATIIQFREYWRDISMSFN